MSSSENASVQEETDSTVRVIEKQAQKRIFKIIVIGDSNVGKTCLTYRFCSGKFPDKTEATIGVDFRERLLDVDSEQIKVKFMEGLFPQWWERSGRVLDLRPRGCRFEPHLSHYIVVIEQDTFILA